MLIYHELTANPKHLFTQHSPLAFSFIRERGRFAELI